MNSRHAERLSQLPPYLFVKIDQQKRAAINAGRDVIDFGIGDPDQPTPSFIIERMGEAIHNPAHHRYAQSVGNVEFRSTVAEWFERRFGVRLDPQSEIASVIGTKEGIGHLPLAVVNLGEIVLVPEPGYPVYRSGTVFAGGQCHTMPLRSETNWLPRFSDIPADVRRRTKLMFLNYPNNPTGACAPLSFFEEAVSFAREHHILIAHDAAYSETFFGDPPPSILQVNGAKDVCIEFHSLSKTFNMTGWRVGFVVGNADAVSALVKVKNNLDSGVFGAIQEAAIVAIKGSDRPEIREQVNVYRRRRDILVDGLRMAGWTVVSPGGTFYVWAKCPSSANSMATATRLLEEAAVVAIPGLGFGSCGEGYIRFALTVLEPRTREAVERIEKIRWPSR